MDQIVKIVELATSIVCDFLDNFAFLGHATLFFDFPSLDPLLEPLAGSVGGQLPLLKYLLSLFLAYPLAFILSQLPGKSLKHAFSLFGGVVMMQWVFGSDWIHALVSSLGTYLICLVAPNKQIHVISFIWVMGYMILAHLYRMHVSYMTGIFDFTGTQMVLTMKLTSFAYNLYDGTADYNNVFNDKISEKKDLAKVYAERKRFAITKLPDPLSFFGYVFCFTCLMAGPAFEYNDYIQGIDGSIVDEKDKTAKKIPSSILPSLLNLVIGTISLVLYLVVSGIFQREMIYDEKWIASNHWLYRFGYSWIMLVADRFKFYFAWKVAEGASTLGGFGFEGFDDKTGNAKGWKGVENIDIVGFETSDCIATLTRHWNKRTQGWLSRYTYSRTNNSLVATYFVSAIWHGLYPGFFIFFMSVPFITMIERAVREKLNPIFAPDYDFKVKGSTIPLWYKFVCWFGTMSTMSYVILPFSLWSWERSMIVLGSYNYIPYAFFIAFYMLLLVIPKRSKGSSKKEVIAAVLPDDTKMKSS